MSEASPFVAYPDHVAVPRESGGFRPLPLELFSVLSHAAGAVMAAVGGIVLLVQSRPSVGVRVSVVVYGLAAVLVFVGSAGHHASKRQEDGKSWWRRLDHAAIFSMIAGTYTPVAYHYLSSGWFVGVMVAQWSLVALGFASSFSALPLPRWATVSIYVAMGWMALLAIGPLSKSMPSVDLGLLLAGGGIYTLGALIYALRWPDPWPNRVGSHGLFHIAVLGGAIAHYALVYRASVGQP